MANPEHVAILRQGEGWNKWRRENPEIRPDLSWEDLSWANLRRADRSEATLRRADLSRADLSWVDGIIQCYADGYLFAGYWYDGQLMILGGCHTFTVAEARKYWRGKPNRAEARAAVNWIVAMAKIKGWGK